MTNRQIKFTLLYFVTINHILAHYLWHIGYMNNILFIKNKKMEVSISPKRDCNILFFDFK